MAGFLNLRKQGNDFYLLATGNQSEGKHFRWKVGKLEEANRSFHEGKKLASQSADMEEWLKCTRSIGVVHTRLATDFQKHESEEWILFNFRSALEVYCEILHNHTNINDRGWLHQVYEKFVVLIEELVKFALSKPNWQQRCSMLEKATPLAYRGPALVLVAVRIQLAVADEIFKAIVLADEGLDWRACLSLTRELNRPICLIKSSLAKSVIFAPQWLDIANDETRLNELQESQIMYEARSLGAQHRSIAEEIFQHLLFEEESLDTDLQWECIDRFSASLVSLRVNSGGQNEADQVPRRDCHCHESYAKTCSGLGLIYEKVIKNEEKAHSLYLQTIQYADIVTHTSGAQFFSKEWYQTAKKGIEAYRRRKEAFDQKEVDKQREPILLKIKPQLDAINAAMNKFKGKMYRSHALLTHVYEKHPPKKGEGQNMKEVDKDDKDALKKALLKATCSYHPDKQYNKSEGIEWRILCEEITKEINNLYDFMKG